MRQRKSMLWFWVGVFLLSSFTHSVYAIPFSFNVSTVNVAMAIDYEGTGTITHMNSPQSPPTPINRGRTSLQDINVMQASDLRIQTAGGAFSFSFSVGQPGITFATYGSFFPGLIFPGGSSVFELESRSSTCSPLSCEAVFSLNSAKVSQLQDLIDTFGADNLLLAGDMFRVSGSGTFSVISAVTPINVDVKLGAFPNISNPRSRGVTPVAILTTSDFDATTVDWPTIRFGASGVEAEPVHAGFDDVDADGDVDLILHFRTQATAIDCETSTAFLRGYTLSGQLIGGRDEIVTVGCE